MYNHNPFSVSPYFVRLYPSLMTMSLIMLEPTLELQCFDSMNNENYPAHSAPGLITE